jgi:hypothetical protein
MDKKINEILELLSINEYDIIGSKKDPNIKDEVISDIDAQEITFTTYEDILKHFQDIFKILKSSKNIIITDFKSGYNHLTELPYRWDYKTIMKGFQYDTEGNKIDFIDTLKIKSIIKIDTVIYYNKEFIEMTLNYYFSFPNHKKTYNIKSNKEISKELKEDINGYIEDKNYYKALKRLNSLYKIIGKQETTKHKKIIDMINSDLGLKAKDKSRLETLLNIIDNYKKPELIKHINEIKIRYNVKTREDIVNKIDELDKEINNKNLKKFIDNII